MTDETTTTTTENAQDKPTPRIRTRTRSRRDQPEAKPTAAADSDAGAGDGRPAPEPEAPSSGEDTDEDGKPRELIRRRRRRARRGRGGATEIAAGEAVAGENAADESAAGEAAAGEPSAEPAAVTEEAAAEVATADAEAQAEGDESAAEEATTTAKARTRKRKRSRRGRDAGTSAKESAKEPTESEDAEVSDDAVAAEAASAEAPAEAAESEDTDVEDSTGPDDASTTTTGSTRLQARGRNRARNGRTRTKPGRRPIGGVSEETRRAITEGPSRRMLVNAGAERTQIAVLEERTLVEHYVTRKEDVSYVGNIYLGRVQNVLPGMEAAFVDIGKGRNGVLYAGEVNYDEADLEGELPRIEDRLKPGQTVLVQVTKDPMGTKGARLTQHLSIAGRYCVLAPGDGMLGISRKLTDEERDRLRKILKAIKPEGFGLIVRTAAEGATQEQLEADVSRLTRIWEQVQTRAKEVKPLDAVYEEPSLVMRVIRDVFGSEFSHLVVDSEELAGQIREYLADVSPEMVDKVEVYTGDEPLLDAYEVTTQVRRALEKKVWLKSGGYLIIEKTEAMWVIDVNTGKFVGTDNLEETVLKNNLEAAEEIARQLRLRDMGGIIVIDFVDMLVPANRDEVLKRFKRELARDKTKSRVMDISKLGLVQMTRKNVSQGLTETFTTPCEVCEGRGAKILESAFK